MRFLQVFLLVVIVSASQVFAAEQPPAGVVVADIGFKEVARSRSFIGTLYYDRISNVSSEFSGLVTRTDARAGEHISKDKPVVYLDTEILEKEISIRKNQIEQARLHIAHSKKNFGRMESLLKSGGIREKDYDDAKMVFKENVLKKTAAATLLEKLLIQKRKSVIKAPFDGIILEKNVDSGDWVQQGKTLITIGSVNDIFVRVPVAETLLKYISMGRKVGVTIHAYDMEMTGIIDSLSPIADARTKNVVLKIKVPLKTRVVQNMSATVFLPTGKTETLAILPRDAVVRSRGKTSVYTIKENRAEKLSVNIVAYLGDSVGADDTHFTEGMKVVVDGNERLYPGRTVVINGND